MLIYRSVQTGFEGSPGYTDFHFGSPEGAPVPATQAIVDGVQGKVTSFWAAVKVLFPPVWNYNVSTEVREVDPVTGRLITSWTSAAFAGGVGAGAAAYAAPAGGIIQWNTMLSNSTGRIRGRTFLVPLGTAAYDATGHIAAGAITAMNTAGVTMCVPHASTYELCVWHRPKAGAGGILAKAVSASPKSVVAVLTSRRR